MLRLSRIKLLIVLMLVLSSLVYGSFEIDSTVCDDDDYGITEDSKLTSDVTCSFWFSEDNIELDCDENEITTFHSDYGITINEDDNIIRLLKALENEILCNFRILICYDSDDDKTLKQIKNNKVIDKELLFIKNPKQGPNSAIIQGINASQAEIILVYMADDFENIKIINNMIKLIEQGYDLVIPSRFIRGGKMIGGKKIKKKITIIGSYLIYYVAGVPYKDCTNAFKMFSRNLKEKINLDSTTGFTYALELTAKAYFLKLKITEIPSIWIETKNRKSSFKIFKWLPYYIYWLIYSLVNSYIFKIKK